MDICVTIRGKNCCVIKESLSYVWQHMDFISQWIVIYAWIRMAWSKAWNSELFFFVKVIIVERSFTRKRVNSCVCVSEYISILFVFGKCFSEHTLFIATDFIIILCVLLCLWHQKNICISMFIIFPHWGETGSQEICEFYFFCFQVN